jgi:two-component system sensor histidine kinase YesM
LEVRDDGVGCTPYKLARIREKLQEDSDEILQSESGFGLENVNKRVKLYYGNQYGITFESQYHIGTQVKVTIPLEQNQPGDQIELEHS